LLVSYLKLFLSRPRNNFKTFFDRRFVCFLFDSFSFLTKKNNFKKLFERKEGWNKMEQSDEIVAITAEIEKTQGKLSRLYEELRSLTAVKKQRGAAESMFDNDDDNHRNGQWIRVSDAVVIKGKREKDEEKDRWNDFPDPLAAEVKREKEEEIDGLFEEVSLSSSSSPTARHRRQKIVTSSSLVQMKGAPLLDASTKPKMTPRQQRDHDRLVLQRKHEEEMRRKRDLEERTRKSQAHYALHSNLPQKSVTGKRPVDPASTIVDRSAFISKKKKKKMPFQYGGGASKFKNNKKRFKSSNGGGGNMQWTDTEWRNEDRSTFASDREGGSGGGGTDRL